MALLETLEEILEDIDSAKNTDDCKLKVYGLLCEAWTAVKCAIERVKIEVSE